MRLLLFLFAFLWVSWLARRFVPRDLVITRQRFAPTWDIFVLRFSQIAIIALSIFTSIEVSAFAVALGLFLYVAGQSMIILAARENPYFIPAIQAPPVVIRTGVYKHLRHPGYIGHFISASGVWLIWSSLYALAPLTLFAALLLWRARKENALLEVKEWKHVSSSSARQSSFWPFGKSGATSFNWKRSRR